MSIVEALKASTNRFNKYLNKFKNMNACMSNLVIIYNNYDNSNYFIIYFALIIRQRSDVKRLF